MGTRLIPDKDIGNLGGGGGGVRSIMMASNVDPPGPPIVFTVVVKHSNPRTAQYGLQPPPSASYVVLGQLFCILSFPPLGLTHVEQSTMSTISSCLLQT
jgi:hypothetical protein